MFKRTIPKDDLRAVFSLTAKILKILYFFMIIGIIFIASLLIREWGILTFFTTILRLISPLFIGFILAWLFEPIVNILIKRSIPRKVATIIIYIVFIGLLYLFFHALLPILYRELLEFIEVIPRMLGGIENFITGFFSRFDNNNLFDSVLVKENMIMSVENYSNQIINDLPDLVLNSITSFISGIWIFIVSLIISFYLLLDFDRKKAFIYKFIKKPYRPKIKELLTKIELALRKWVNGAVLVSLTVFALSSLGFIIIGLPSPVLFGFILGILDIIPYAGPLIGGTLAVIIGFTDSTSLGFLALLVVIIVQQLENWFIHPVIMAKSIKIHPVIIILSLIIFGHFFGIIGMMLATPIISILKVLISYLNTKYNLFSP